MTRPLLVVDDREKDVSFLRGLESYFTPKVKHLAVGDYVWSCPLGTVGVERKSAADLDASHSNKRLDDELRRLVDTYSVPVLFLTGNSGRRDEFTIENTKLGRQLHGVYVYHVGRSADVASEGLFRLWKYTQERMGGAIDGVRRERKFAFAGPISPRAEVIYGILGLAGGIRDRRAAALQIAETTPLSDFMRWSVSDFLFAGFSKLMAKKLADTIRQLEEQPNRSP